MDSGLFAVCAPSLPELAVREPAAEVGGGMGLVHSALQVPMGQLGESMGEAFPLSSEQAFCWSLDAFRRDCIPLMPSRNLISHSPDLLPPPSHGAFTLMLCMLQERNECLWQHSTQLGKPTIHCPFPSWEKSQAIKFSPKLCHLAGGDASKVKLFLLLTPVHPNSCFALFCFTSTECLNFSANLDFHIGSLVCD